MSAQKTRGGEKKWRKGTANSVIALFAFYLKILNICIQTPKIKNLGPQKMVRAKLQLWYPSNEQDLTHLLKVLGSSSHVTRGQHSHPEKKILPCKICSWFVAEGKCLWLPRPVLSRKSAPFSSTRHSVFRRGLIHETAFPKPPST